MAFTQKIDDITALPEVTLSTGLSTQQLGAINAISRNGSARVTSMCGCKRTTIVSLGRSKPERCSCVICNTCRRRMSHGMESWWPMVGEGGHVQRSTPLSRALASIRLASYGSSWLSHHVPQTTWPTRSTTRTALAQRLPGTLDCIANEARCSKPLEPWLGSNCFHKVFFCIVLYCRKSCGS